MRIIACSYKNIWPFADCVRTVRFLLWTVLIKAPIGSGKSFLFFDGLIFGLYKWGSRPMLHRHATQGQIQVLFAHAWACWLIIRELKSTKAGNDSVTSTLFRVQATYEMLDELFVRACGQQIICDDIIIDQLIPSSWCEQVPALWQKEIETMILDLLPSREVTLSSCVLMQDSDNIFEMTPAIRINVFKQLFDLLDMDHVRDHLADLKRTTQMRRGVLQEDMTVQQQFTTCISQLRTTIAWLETLDFADYKEYVWDWFSQPFFHDLSLLDTSHLQVEWSFLQGYDEARTSTLLQAINDLVEKQTLRQGEYQQLTRQYETIDHQAWLLAWKLKTIQQRLEEQNTILSTLPMDRIQHTKEELVRLDEAIDQLWHQIPVEQAKTYGIIFTSVIQAQQVMYQRIAEAKQTQQDLLSAEEKQTILTWQYDHLVAQLAGLQAQASQREAEQARTELFFCDKIQGNCPYVDLVKQWTSKRIGEQQDYLQKQIVDFRDVRLPELLQGVTTTTEQVHMLRDLLEKQRAVFTALGWKALEQIFFRADELYSQRKLLTDRIRDDQLLLDSSATLLEQQRADVLLLEKTTQEHATIQAQRTLLANQIAEYDEHTYQHSLALGKQLGSWLQRFEQLIALMRWLIDQYVDRQQQIRELQEKELLVKDLLQIFQKELLIVVLQDFLPVLEDLINTYLHQIVSFSLRFELPKTVQEQMELVIWVEDEKGRRAVKSLSGWQKSVLRLCRILAVSTLFKQEYLLLDETINSLDQEAIGRVAELLDNFVKQREMTFYLVTHAPQIQDMWFWRHIVEL